MSSDFGVNKNRVDIKFGCDTKHYKTWKEIIKAVRTGETVIYAGMSAPFYPNQCQAATVYHNFFCRQIRKLGITDIRYGSKGYRMNGGEGYTLYKPTNFKKGVA